VLGIFIKKSKIIIICKSFDETYRGTNVISMYKNKIFEIEKSLTFYFLAIL